MAQFIESDGYISDVHTAVSSNFQSDISNDFRKQYSEVEEQFKNKYRALRSGYEQRIRQLFETVQETCSNLFSDELLNELKQDKTSSSFIPAHIAEIIDRHLESDREFFIHQMLLKLSNVEVEHHKLITTHKALQQKNSTLEIQLQSHQSTEAVLQSTRERLTLLEKEHKTYSFNTTNELTITKQNLTHLQNNEQRLQEEIHSLQQALQHKSTECSQLLAENTAQSHTIHTLEQSFDQSAADLAAISAMENQQQALKNDMKMQITSLANERNSLSAEVNDLRSQLTVANDHLLTMQQNQRAQQHEDEVNKQRVGALITYFEGMLTQEVADSNATITSVYEKMKGFRTRMLSELQREKRHASSLQERLDSLKNITNDHQRLLEETNQLRKRLTTEEAKAQSIQTRLDDTSSQLSGCQLKLKETEIRLRSMEENSNEAAASLQQNSIDMERRIRLRLELEAEEQRLQLAKKEAAMQLHYRNSSNSNSSVAGAVGGVSNSLMLWDEQLLQAAANNNSNKWVQEKLEMQQACEMQVQEAISKTKSQYTGRIRLLKEKLAEAGTNIERLRGMVESNRTVIASQNTVIKQLNVIKNAQIESLKALNESSSHNNSVNVQDSLTKSMRSVATETTGPPSWLPSHNTNLYMHNTQQNSVETSTDLPSHFNTNGYHNHSDQESVPRSLTRLLPTPMKATPLTVRQHVNSTPSTSNNNSYRNNNNLKSPSERCGGTPRNSSHNTHQNTPKVGITAELLVEDWDVPMRSSTSKQLNDYDNSNHMDYNINTNSNHNETPSNIKQRNNSSSSNNNKLFSNTIVSEKENTLPITEKVHSLQLQLESSQQETWQCQQREMKLKHLLREMYRIFTQQIDALKQDVISSRSVVKALPGTIQLMMHSTVSTLRMEFTGLFDHLSRMHKSGLLQQRVELNNTHTAELNALEESYRSQLHAVSEKHAGELTRVHNDVMGQAERVINMVGCANLYNTNPSNNYYNVNNANNSTDNSSLLLDMTTITHPPTNFRDDTLLLPSSKSDKAFPSVLHGVVEALELHEMIDTTQAADLTALAHTHNEPSVAASVAAKSLLSSHIDKFLMKYNSNNDLNNSLLGSSYT
mmetsp:Transcript_4715/g.6575  ORF Transcript_4715/g.6575 Transcript_4715/m.6575 type:complete len:1100 (+) Transcript_4715:55-3354(+)